MNACLQQNFPIDGSVFSLHFDHNLVMCFTPTSKKRKPLPNLVWLIPLETDPKESFLIVRFLCCKITFLKFTRIYKVISESILFFLYKRKRTEKCLRLWNNQTRRYCRGSESLVLIILIQIAKNLYYSLIYSGIVLFFYVKIFTNK